MTIRKVFSILLLAALLLGMFACSPAATPTEEAAPEQPAEEQPVAEEPAEEPMEEVAEEPTEEAAVEEPMDVVTLDYYWVGNQDTDQRELVEAAINEYVEPIIGVNVVFHIVGWGDWASKAVTGLQAGEKMDIFFTADWWHYMQLSTEGLFAPLNDDNGENGNLLELYGQDILSSLNPAFITGTQIDGVNYAVPTNKELTVPEGFLYNVTVAEAIGFTPEDAAAVKSYADMEPWLAKAKEAFPEMYPYLTDGRDGFSPWPQDLASGVSGRLINMLIAPDASGNFDETILSIYETDYAKQLFATMRDWYNKGYIHPDSGLSTWDTSVDFNAGNFFIQPMPLKGNNIKAQEMVNSSGNPDLKLGEIYGQPKVNITTHAGGSMLAIPMLSEYQVQAMKFINLMHSDSTLLNMMLFGVEGTHWEFEADGRVNLIDSAWYGAHPGAWTLGNTMLQAVTNNEDPDKNRMLIEYSNDAIDHPALGFRFRTEPIAAELTAVNAVHDGMAQALYTGYVDPEVELPGFIEALKGAGLDTILAEVQAQYDAWKAAK
jgi:putative aldouronate transport system substrate-binding protein